MNITSKIRFKTKKFKNERFKKKLHIDFEFHNSQGNCGKKCKQQKCHLSLKCYITYCEIIDMLLQRI